MADTLMIGLDPKDRATLQELARARGLGVSALGRELAETEALRARRAAIRTGLGPVMRPVISVAVG